MGHFYYSKRFVPRVRTNVKPRLKQILERRKNENQSVSPQISKDNADLQASVTGGEAGGSSDESSGGHERQQPDLRREESDESGFEQRVSDGAAGREKSGDELGNESSALTPAPILPSRRRGRPAGTTKAALAQRRKKNK